MEIIFLEFKIKNRGIIYERIIYENISWNNFDATASF